LITIQIEIGPVGTDFMGVTKISSIGFPGTRTFNKVEIMVASYKQLKCQVSHSFFASKDFRVCLFLF